MPFRGLDVLYPTHPSLSSVLFKDWCFHKALSRNQLRYSLWWCTAINGPPMYCAGCCCGYIFSVPSCFRRGTGWAEIPGSGGREFLPLSSFRYSYCHHLDCSFSTRYVYVHATSRQAFSYQKLDIGSLTCETDMWSLTCETVLVRAVHTKLSQAAASLQEGWLGRTKRWPYNSVASRIRTVATGFAVQCVSQPATSYQSLCLTLHCHWCCDKMGRYVSHFTVSLTIEYH